MILLLNLRTICFEQLITRYNKQHDIFSFMCMFCRSLFVLLSFFCWPLCPSSIYRFWLRLWYHQTLLTERGRFGALKSDSTHHFFRNACTKSGSLRFSVFQLLTDFVCLYNYEFWLSLCKIVPSSVVLLLPLFSVFVVFCQPYLFVY